MDDYSIAMKGGADFIDRSSTLVLFFVVLLWTGQCQHGTTILSDFYVPAPYRLLGYGDDWRWRMERVYDTAWLELHYTMRFWNQDKSAKIEDYRIMYVGKGGNRKAVSWRIEEAERRWQADSGLLYMGEYYPMEWVTDSQGQSVCLFRLLLLRQSTMIEYAEPAAKFAWVLLPETDSVGGYLCQKAETEYKGRNYEAWFCPEIPIDAGPYKFRGLPGLILKVEDETGDYAWELYEGGIHEVSVPMVEKDYIRRKTTRERARRLIQRVFDSPFGYTMQTGRNVVVRTEKGDRPLTEAEMESSIFYTPIELE